MVPAEVRARVRVRARVCMNACMLQKYRESTRLLSLYIYILHTYTISLVITNWRTLTIYTPKHELALIHSQVHTHTRTHERTHARTHTHTFRLVRLTYISFVFFYPGTTYRRNCAAIGRDR